MTYRIECGDCLELMADMADNSVNLLVTDPPYYRVKALDWDRQWATPVEFLDWMRLLVAEWHRILAPNGSLYVFASPSMAARVECVIGERFNVLNRICWSKQFAWNKGGDTGKPARVSEIALRQFYGAAEYIIFAEHYGADNIAKGESGYGAKCDELRGFVFEPLQEWFRLRIRQGGLNHRAINEAIGSCTSGGGMASHYFGDTGQYSLPTESMYAKMRGAWPALFDREYEDLRREYEDLRREYEDLRRPFSVTADVPYTDVWTFPTVQSYPGKHPCEKPLEMLEHIVKASSREGDLVLDCFCGSGNSGKAAVKHDRDYIGYDIQQHWCDVAEQGIAEMLEPLPLFAEMAAQ